MPVTEILNQFNEQTDALSGYLLEGGQQTTTGTQRSWAYPANLVVGPLSVGSIAAAFNREEASQQYGAAVEEGRYGDLWASKTQNDYLATIERAFRARHATHVRCATHAAARRLGQGDSGGVFKAVRDYLQSVLDKAYQQPSEPPPLPSEPDPDEL